MRMRAVYAREDFGACGELGRMQLTRARAMGILGTLPVAFAALPGRAADVVPIRIGAESSEPFMEPFYAADQGIFTRNGVTATTEAFGNGSVVLNAVIGNALDIGNTDLIPIANAVNHGFDLAIIASGGLHATESVTIALCVSKNSTVRGPKDLEGQTIGLPQLKSAPQMEVIEWLRRGGADPAKVSFYEMHFSEMVPALQRGTIAAALNGEPFITDSKDATRIIGVPADTVSLHYYSGIWYGRRSYLDANAASIKRLIAAFYDTARWANAHRPQTAEILSRYSKIEVDRVRNMSRVQFATGLDPKLAQPLLDFAATYKLLDKPTNAVDLFWKGA
jgi:NitT/TauT family transport system substrate-binding protein